MENEKGLYVALGVYIGELQKPGRSLWTMYCFMDHRDLERQRLQGSLQMRWVPT